MAFRTMIARYPDQQTSVITLCNVGDANSGRLSTAVEDVMLADAFTEDPQASGSAPSSEDAGQVEVTVPESDIAMMAGRYHSPELGATWVLEGAGPELILHHPNGNELTLKARSPTLFVRRGLELHP